jgi:hypothetical protein
MHPLRLITVAGLTMACVSFVIRLRAIAIVLFTAWTV